MGVCLRASTGSKIMIAVGIDYCRFFDKWFGFVLVMRIERCGMERGGRGEMRR